MSVKNTHKYIWGKIQYVEVVCRVALTDGCLYFPLASPQQGCSSDCALQPTMVMMMMIRLEWIGVVFHKLESGILVALLFGYMPNRVFWTCFFIFWFLNYGSWHRVPWWFLLPKRVNSAFVKTFFWFGVDLLSSDKKKKKNSTATDLCLSFFFAVCRLWLYWLFDIVAIFIITTSTLDKICWVIILSLTPKSPLCDSC